MAWSEATRSPSHRVNIKSTPFVISHLTFPSIDTQSAKLDFYKPLLSGMVDGCISFPLTIPLVLLCIGGEGIIPKLDYSPRIPIKVVLLTSLAHIFADRLLSSYFPVYNFFPTRVHTTHLFHSFQRLIIPRPCFGAPQYKKDCFFPQTQFPLKLESLIIGHREEKNL